jgi:hypothetical protein
MEQALFLDLLFIASAEVHLKSLEAQALFLVCYL